MGRRLIHLLTLLAVLFMPLTMNGAVAASTGGHHEMGGMPMSHCPDPDSQPESTQGIAACTMICAAALPAADARMPECTEIPELAAEVLLIRVLAGLHPEAADPPPKFA